MTTVSMLSWIFLWLLSAFQGCRLITGTPKKHKNVESSRKLLLKQLLLQKDCGGEKKWGDVITSAVKDNLRRPQPAPRSVPRDCHLSPLLHEESRSCGGGTELVRAAGQGKWRLLPARRCGGRGPLCGTYSTLRSPTGLGAWSPRLYNTPLQSPRHSSIGLCDAPEPSVARPATLGGPWSPKDHLGRPGPPCPGGGSQWDPPTALSVISTAVAPSLQCPAGQRWDRAGAQSRQGAPEHSPHLSPPPLAAPVRPRRFAEASPLPIPSLCPTGWRRDPPPSVAWEKDGALQESSSPPEPDELCMVQPLLTGISQLPMYEEEQEIVDVIQAFVSSPEKVTTAISNTAVLESADRGSAARLLEVCWLGRAASPRPPTQHCTPSAPVPLAVCPQLSHSLFVSLSPGCQEEGQKMKFLKSICNLCTSTRYCTLSQCLDVFCHR
ncbi:uncharacterized protein ACIBXB_006317 [Morphnus guianensis]